MNGSDPGLNALLMNSSDNTVKPQHLSKRYQLSQGVNGGRGYLTPNGVVTFHNTMNNTMTVDKQTDIIKRNS